MSQTIGCATLASVIRPVRERHGDRSPRWGLRPNSIDPYYLYHPELWSEYGSSRLLPQVQQPCLCPKAKVGTLADVLWPRSEKNRLATQQVLKRTVPIRRDRERPAFLEIARIENRRRPASQLPDRTGPPHIRCRPEHQAQLSRTAFGTRTGAAAMSQSHNT